MKVYNNIFYCFLIRKLANNFGNDFGDFMSRDPFFNSATNQSNNSNINNSVNSFPIGTFSIEQTTNTGQQQQPGHMNFNQSDYFSSNNGMSNGGGGAMNGTIGTMNNSTMGTMNGTIGTFNANTNNSGAHVNHSNSNNNNNNNNANGDPGQATRETGIIEKLLVSIFIIFLRPIDKMINDIQCVFFYFILAFVWFHSMLRTSSTFIFPLFAIQW